ncbi:MAG: hypothetical protein F3742_11015 [Nitrospinae bacterium]|nr:hypothetical protein [Nitrospinota bacterium]
MLVFKNNIYEPFLSSNTNVVLTPDEDYNQRFNPLHLIQVALQEEKEVIAFIARQPSPFWGEDLLQFYPYSGKTRSLTYIKQICHILESGLGNFTLWQHMNSYHFSFLYDVLIRFIFNYNHDSDKERISQLPELKAQPIYLENFLKNYFFDWNFKTNEDHFNSLTQKQKRALGFDCPYLFGVINGLIPTREEMSLTYSQDFPYSIYV